MALWATQMAMAANGFGRTLGREITEDDVEPVNWIQAEHAAQLSAVDYATALAASYAFRREVQQWWARRLGPAAHADARPSRRPCWPSSIAVPGDPSAPDAPGRPVGRRTRRRST